MSARIDGKDIEHWADTNPDAHRVLHQLVCRLLWASTKIRRLDLSAGTAINLGGWDGICEAVEGSPHCPLGLSGWELSKRADVKKKLDEDYEKRIGGPSPLQAKSATYVAVTARRYPKKQEWAAARNSDGKWAHVRILDADDLAQWLEESPAVTAWFACEQLRRPAYELSSIDRFLRDWSHETTQIHLPPSLMLLGRDEQREQILQWSTQSQATALSIQAATKREAQLFVAAVFDSLDAGQRERLASRTLIVETADAWRWATRQQGKRPLILIPTFPEFGLSSGRGTHFAVVPLDREIEVDEWGVIVIDEPLPWRELAAQLQVLRLPESKAWQVAEQSGGHLRPLQRLLGATETRLPAWATRAQDHAEIAAMLLLGAWQPSHEGDRRAAETLGANADKLDRLCTRLTKVEGAPIEREAGGYRWASSPYAWKLLVGLLSEQSLRNFRTLAIDVLGEDDPKYERPAEERFFAAVVGLVPSHSWVLRQALPTSVLHLSRHEFRVSLGTRTAEIVRKVLAPPWNRWASISNGLAALAEAAPDVFLERLTESLTADDGVGQLFAEEGPPALDGAAPHVPLLRAVELLAWAPESMALATDLLARLTQRDPPATVDQPRIGNRPFASLEAVFHIITPQTLVADEDRFEVLENLVRRYPTQGFALLTGLVGHLRGGLLPQSMRPQYDVRVPASPQMPTHAQVGARGRRCFELALDGAGDDPDRWALLIGKPINQTLGDEPAQRMVDRLLALRNRFDDEACLRIRDAARTPLYMTSLHEKLSVRREQLLRIVAAFEPSDPVLRASWLFAPGARPLEPHSLSSEEEVLTKLDRLRDPALTELLARQDALELLGRLVAQLENRSQDLRGLGRSLARSNQNERFDELLLRRRPPAPLQALVAPFAVSRHWFLRADGTWLETLVRHWLGQGRDNDALATLHREWAEPRIWDLVDTIGEPLKTHYWAGLHNLGNHDGEQWERSVNNLLAAENFYLALSTASYRCRELPIDVLVNVLEGLPAAPSDHETPRPGPSLAYEIEEIFREFERRDDDGKLDSSAVTKITALELRFINLFGLHFREPRFVSRCLESSPAFFVSLLVYRYRGEGEPAEHPVDPETKRLAHNAYSVLESWRSFPGRELGNPRAWEPLLHQWATDVLELASAKQRLSGAEAEIAKVLARPASEDGHWPCEAARQLLQTGKYPELASALRIARLNQPGTTTRGSYEGGAQERALAERYERSARALSAKWPKTALLLDNLARHYQQVAEYQDRDARELRLREGVGPQQRERKSSTGQPKKPNEEPPC